MRALILCPMGVVALWGAAFLADRMGLSGPIAALVAVIVFSWYVWAVGTA